MLVLKRKQNESIVISDNICISVFKVNGNTVRLGIEALQEVKVLRGELVPCEMIVDSRQATGSQSFLRF